MLEVGIIGAPGAGKSKVAAKVLNELHCGWGPHGSSAAIYRKKPLGLAADYITNILIAASRTEASEQFRSQKLPYILDGTLVECCAYSAMAVDLLSKEPQTPRAAARQLRAFYTASTIAVMALDELPRQTLFYLPITSTEDGSGYPLTVDAAIRDAIDALAVPVRIIKGDDRAEQILNALQEQLHDA